jgi:hypothetical protein
MKRGLELRIREGELGSTFGVLRVQESVMKPLPFHDRCLLFAFGLFVGGELELRQWSSSGVHVDLGCAGDEALGFAGWNLTVHKVVDRDMTYTHQQPPP